MTTMRILLRYWWRLRARGHANLYHPADVTPTVDGFLVECSCGGHGQVQSNGDRTSTVTDTTCPLWAWRWRCLLVSMPAARTIARLRGWNEITWSFLVDLRRGIVQMTKLIKSSP
jgi:hypothetical protein